MSNFKTLSGLLATSILAFALQTQAATTTTGVDNTSSKMGVTGNGCVQLLTIAVSEGENCMYDGGQNVYEPISGSFPADPVGESTGPFSQVQYYDYGTHFWTYDVIDPPGVGYFPSNGDGKIAQVISGSFTIDDQGDGFGANDTISFDLTMTSPSGGDIVRNLGLTVADKYTSMNQVLAPTVADSVTANASGGFDYVIGTEGFPVLLTFTDASADESVPGAGDGPCVGQTFGDMECDANFDVNAFSEPLRWAPWMPTDQSTFKGNPTPPGQFDPPHVGPSQSPGLGSMEDNIGARTTGTVTNLTCIDDGVIGTSATNTPCFSSKVSFAPLVIGPNDTPGDGATAEDVGWDHVYLLVSTNAAGAVLTVEGFNVHEYQVFGVSEACGSDPGATYACNSWLGGHFMINGVVAADDTAETAKDVAVTIDVLANDNGFVDDVDVTVPGGTSANGGTVVVNGSPGPQAGINITYTPPMGFSGSDTFDYTVAEEAPGTSTSTATVTINVLSGANNDTASTRLNTSINIPVGANDGGFADPATITVTAAPNMGGSIDAINGSPGPADSMTIDYTPVAALGTATYTETFTYEVDDGVSPPTTAVVTITVNNEVPAAVAATASAAEGTATTTDVSGLAGVSLGDAPATVSATDGTDGTTSVAGTVITYTPTDPFFSATDTYDYTITDDDGETDTATVTVTIGPKLTPTAVPDMATVDQDDAVNIIVTANDVAGSGALAAHTVVLATPPSNGTALADAGGDIAYSPAAGFAGTDSFEYTLTDLDGDSSTTTVTVTINQTTVEVPLPHNSALGPWSLMLLMLVPWLRQRRRSCSYPSGRLLL